MRRLYVLVLVAGLAVGCEALRPAQPVVADAPRRYTAPTALKPLPPVEVLRASAQLPAAPVAAQVVPEDAIATVQVQQADASPTAAPDPQWALARLGAR